MSIPLGCCSRCHEFGRVRSAECIGYYIWDSILVQGLQQKGKEFQMLDSDSDREQNSKVSTQLRGQTKDIESTKYHSFAELGLEENILLALAQAGFNKPTPIQEESIPLIRQRKSIIARAKNGTGKTAAYLIPILNEIDVKKNSIQAVVMANTRELAFQVQEIANKFAKFKGVKIESLIGGRAVKEDHAKIEEEGIHLAICTAGRLKDLLNKKKNLLADCAFFVLDEADSLLKDKTEYDISDIIQFLPKKCGLYLYSATFPVRIKSFKQKFMPDAEVINLMDELMLLGLTHYYILVEESEKLQYLYKIYSELIVNQCIIFCKSNKRAEFLSKKMKSKGFENEYLTSNTKEERLKIFQRFRKGEFKTLISSNLVSRGIDVPSVNVVINFDFPDDAPTYLHRIGRSGRYGQIGLAINLITDADQENVLMVEKELDTAIDAMPEHIDESLYC